MPLKKSAFDLLRPGVLLSEKLKLLERIPRWIAGRRFLADHAGQRVQLLFFEEAGGNRIESWQETLPLIQGLENKSLLPVHSIENLRGFRFLLAEEVRGPCMRTQLDEEGVLAPEDARDVLASLRDALRAMRLAGLEAPAIVPQTILLVESDVGLRPTLFPWALAAYPPTPPDEVSRRLRDLLYTATTNLEPPASYSPKALHALPAAIRDHWQAVFADSPDWTALDAWTPSSIRAQLPLERPVPPTKPAMGKRSRSMPLTVTQRAVGMRPPADNLSRPQAFNAWPTISAFASLAAAAAVIWFSFALVESLRARPHLPCDVCKGKEGTAPMVNEELPSPEPGLAGPPPDPSDEPGANLMVWYERWQEQRDNREFTSQFSSYIRGLTPHADAMRSGRMPALLNHLEGVARDGPPAATFLLAQVLWGRETQRAEQMMKKIAREGYEPARAWCREQFIDWQ